MANAPILRTRVAATPDARERPPYGSASAFPLPPPVRARFHFRPSTSGPSHLSFRRKHRRCGRLECFSSRRGRPRRSRRSLGGWARGRRPRCHHGELGGAGWRGERARSGAGAQLLRAGFRLLGHLELGFPSSCLQLSQFGVGNGNLAERSYRPRQRFRLGEASRLSTGETEARRGARTGPESRCLAPPPRLSPGRLRGMKSGCDHSFWAV